MTLVNLGKLIGAVLSFVIAYFTYRDIKSKKLLGPGDNRFFDEVKNGVGFRDYFGSRRLIIALIIIGISLIAWAFE